MTKTIKGICGKCKENKMPQPKDKEQWEVEFDKKFDYAIPDEDDNHFVIKDKADNFPAGIEQIKDFISDLLAAEREKAANIITKIALLPEPNPYGTTLTVKRHNQVIREVLKALHHTNIERE